MIGRDHACAIFRPASKGGAQRRCKQLEKVRKGLKHSDLQRKSFKFQVVEVEMGHFLSPKTIFGCDFHTGIFTPVLGGKKFGDYPLATRNGM